MAQKQGLFNDATAFAAQAVSDYVYDKELAYNQIVAFEEENNFAIAELDKEFKDALQEGKDLAFTIWQEAKAEKTQVMDLNLQFPDAGINLDDTIEEANVKAGLVAETDKAREIALATAKRVEALDITTGLKKADATRFFGEIDSGVNELQQGREWGEVWDRIKLQFPTVPSNVIDKALGTQWREAGAFQEFQAKKGGGTLSKTEREATVWQWLSTDEAKALNDDEKSQQIKSFGLDPESFGIF